MRGYDAWKLACPYDSDDPGRQTDPGICRLCNGSGEYAVSIRTGRYISPGQVPDDARRVRVVQCEPCGGTGEIIIEDDEP